MITTRMSQAKSSIPWARRRRCRGDDVVTVGAALLALTVRSAVTKELIDHDRVANLFLGQLAVLQELERLRRLE